MIKNNECINILDYSLSVFNPDIRTKLINLIENNKKVFENFKKNNHHEIYVNFLSYILDNHRIQEIEIYMSDNYLIMSLVENNQTFSYMYETFELLEYDLIMIGLES